MSILRTKIMLYILTGAYTKNKSLKTGTRRIHTNFKTGISKRKWSEMALLIFVNFIKKKKEVKNLGTCVILL